MFILVSFYIFIFLIFWSFREYKKYGISLTFMTLMWSIVIYVLAPLALFNSYYEVASPRFLRNNYDISSLLPLFVIIIFFISMFFGSIFFDRVGFKLKLETSNELIRKTVLILFAIGGISLFFFIYTYGGLDYVLSNMSKIRSGTDDNKNYLAAFVSSFSKYINLSFFIIFSLILIKKNLSRFDYFLLFLCTLATLFSLYLSAGREAGIAFLISILVIYLAVYKKIPVLTVFVFSLFSFMYILFGKTFLFALNNENFDKGEFIENNFLSTIGDSYNIIVSEFSHQYLSLVNFMQYDYDFRFFGDYAYWLFKPFKLLGFNIPDSISYYNTFIIHGVWDSEIPPGGIAFGYIQFGIVGVIIHGFILGCFFKFFDVIFDPKNQNNPILLGFYAVLVTSFTYMLSNSDPALFLQNRIPNILFLLALLFVFNAKLVKK
ncbi:oligosaccharide repeat unit polymerase [Acinetobacter sp. ANC 4779]|uniref:O-antigen polymerase n=1 Tax=Acinetobacter sp. ANC 4779 TaxID=2529848 RepID=UPI00103C315B|nr:O-antigen polymerase [Acinetobacter sp. ANC 4779]TCB49199.1 oligosaccharide repeat unit polymerase [Acinetobacter sp. ANC 4779]